jgi:multidrug efflux pump subunit AcrA (membrane-fusion protein)
VLLIAVGLAFTRMKEQPVVASRIVRGQAIDAVYATGTVEAEDRVEVKTKAAGSVLEIVVKEGGAVHRGDLLARIDNPAMSFDLARGQADLTAAAAQSGQDAPRMAALLGQWKAADAELGSARRELSRVEKLEQAGSVSAAEADRARALVRELEGRLAANEAEQRALRIDLSANAARQSANVQSLASRVRDTEVRAPLDGVVLARRVELGEVVGVNQALFKLGNVERLVLEVSVDEADIARVHDGAGGKSASIVAVSLYAFPKQIFRGQVFEILPDANRDRKAFLAKVRLDAPPRGLRSGMSAEVNIIAAEREGALLSPAEAISEGALWLVKDGRAHRSSVKIGLRDLLRAEILEGAAEGDEVIVSGQDHVAEGKRVVVTHKEPDKMQPMPDIGSVGQTSM